MGDTLSKTEAETIRDLAFDASDPTSLPTGAAPQVFVVPDGHLLHVVDPEEFEDAPRRVKGTYSLADIPSLIDYGKQHYSAGLTTVWIDQLAANVQIVLNDADKGTPGWRDHIASCQLVKTPEWRHWSAANGRMMDQQKFAEHIEEGLLEITEPAQADMLEIAQSIQGKTDANWQSASRLADGAIGFSYTEQVQATAGRKGELQIPYEFKLGIAPFYGEDRHEFNARLRYRVKEGNLMIGYKIERPEAVELAVMKAIVERLRAGGFERVYLGTPAA